MAEKLTTSKTTRIITLSGAILFLVTSSALAFFVIYDLVTEDDDPLVSTTQTLDSKDDSAAPNTPLAGTKLSGFTPVSDVSKLEIKDLKAGEGQTVQPGDTVTVNYTGALAASGVIFESSLDSGQPATFPLNGVIKGWTDGLPGMKVGGERQLIIPAELAYGSEGNANIPPNAALVFNITLLAVSSGDQSNQ